MPKNYYLILGVNSDADVEEIKAAFRRRALELHPDTSGLESEPFLEVQEAYGVLTNPERRQRYDQQRRPTAAPLRKPPPKGEPFRPVEGASGFSGVSLAQSFANYRPSLDELFSRWWSNFDSASRPKAETLESLTVEMALSPEEARFGGRVRVEIPVRSGCPTCRGRGAVGPYRCQRCAGRGMLTAEYPVEVEYPPAFRDGYTVNIPLASYGIKNFFLRVLFRVGGG